MDGALQRRHHEGTATKPSSEGKRVAFDGEERTVIYGPFPAVSELV